MSLSIVTGAGAGIGRETAKLFADRGDTVIVADIDLEAAEATVEQIAAAGGIAAAYRLDVASEEQWEAMAQWVLSEHHAPDVLVNNAGIMDIGGFVDMSAAQWQRTIDIDLMSVIYGSRIFAQQMIDGGVKGHIVNISSVAAFLPSKVVPAYGVAKAAVLMASQSLRVELRSKGIGVTAICPGVIGTDLLAHGERAGITEQEQAEWREKGSKAQALAFAGPDKVARAIERSIRRNSAIVPVNPEAWMAYGFSRLAPSTLRAVVSIGSFERADALLQRFAPLITRLSKQRPSATENDNDQTFAT
jgi:NAD(P)-dependent dehydrogenase (short-subunit alcohol dehydrogenase family)